MKFGSKKAIFGAIWGVFEGFGPCLGSSFPRYIIVVSYSISSAAHGGGIKDSKAEWPYPVLRCTALAAFVFPTFSIYHSLFHLFILRKRFKGKNELSFMKDFSRHCLVGGTGFVGFRKR